MLRVHPNAIHHFAIIAPKQSGINYTSVTVRDPTRWISFHKKLYAEKKSSKLMKKVDNPITIRMSMCMKTISIEEKSYSITCRDSHPTTPNDALIISSALFGNCFCKERSTRFITKQTMP